MTEEILLPDFSYRGARALVVLHELYLEEFVEAWQDAKAQGVMLPEVDDPDYASLETLLHHVLRAARGYMTWICEKLELPDPDIRKTPSVDVIEEEVDDYLEHILDRWRLPLAAIEEAKFHEPTYKSRWEVDYCIDAMLEHAVMHPIRHIFQLEELMEEDEEN